jgi:hypothetical protein
MIAGLSLGTHFSLACLWYPVLSRLARLAARWKLPAMEQDAYAYPTRVRILTTISPD